MIQNLTHDRHSRENKIHICSLNVTWYKRKKGFFWSEKKKELKVKVNQMGPMVTMMVFKDLELEADKTHND